MTKTIFVNHHPFRGDLPIIHFLDVKRFSREGMIGFVKSFDGNGTRVFFFSQGGSFFNQNVDAKVEIIHKSIQPNLTIAQG
jgi:hypothetical protein